MKLNLKKRSFKVILMSSVALIVFLTLKHPIILKLFGSYLGFGYQTRLVGTAQKCSMQIGGEEFKKAKCFLSKKNFSGKFENRLLIYFQKSSALGQLKGMTLVIDVDNKTSGRPNSSNMEYDLILGAFLIQSESGYNFIPFENSTKFCGRDSNTEIIGNRITLTIPCGYPGLNNSKLLVELNKK